jgi:hypothetical protein
VDLATIGRSNEPARPRVTVSGSFKRHLGAIQKVVHALLDAGAVVLSPADPRIVDAFGEFVFVHSDVRRSIKGVQNRHLQGIRHSDFLWLVCPDGYVGQSAAMELGFAVANGTPVYSDVAPTDWTLRQYVTPVGSVEHALAARSFSPAARTEHEVGLLLTPERALLSVRRDLDVMEHHLLGDHEYRGGDPVESSADRIRLIMTLPGGTSRP